MDPVVPGEGSLLVANVRAGSAAHLGDCPCALAFTDPSALFRAQRNSRRDIYQKPRASDVEKTKTTHLKEQKAFAVIREILGRQPRLLTSNLPTRWFST